MASALKLDLPNYAPEECPICKEGKLPLVHLGSRKMKEAAKQTQKYKSRRSRRSTKRGGIMQAYLILANGRVFRGVSVGCPGTTIGEVVFATGMVGFEETLTDPSYYGQIITQTYPLIGNYGMNSEDVESGKIWARVTSCAKHARPLPTSAARKRWILPERKRHHRH